MSSEKTKQTTVQTTGHAWDGDIQEFNNPIPIWWLWSFYATVIFTIVYLTIFPAIPIGSAYTEGVMNNVTYKNADGIETTTHWNSRALFMKEMQAAREMQKPYIDKITRASYTQIAKDKNQSAFAFSTAKVLFADNCAACHQTGGAGVVGLYPNLADDAWLWGGSYKNIEATIRNGRIGSMPGFKASLSPVQIDNVAEYVLKLSGEKVNATNAAKGKFVFEGTGSCFACHTNAGSGQIAMGSANLTDKIWTVVEFNGATTLADKKAAVAKVIHQGIKRDMPAWQGRLSESDIKMLTFYVHQIGGGQ